MQQLMERNRELQLENEEIPVLKDSMEEMKYLESKVVRVLTRRVSFLARLSNSNIGHDFWVCCGNWM